MLVDAHSLPRDSVLETDVCVVGAGPAGITLARELNGSSLRVCLLESGGTARNSAIQALSRLSIADSDITPAHQYRRRQFGGTSHFWTVGRRPLRSLVRHLPLDAIDFELRDWVPDSGWPISRADVDPFYVRAHRALGLGAFEYDVESLEGAGGRPLAPDSALLRTSVEWFGRAKPVIAALQELRRSGNVTVVLRGTAVALEDDARGERIDRLRVNCLNGTRHVVVASVFVLAAGGVENPRLLLLSNGRRPEGIGNRHDLVGRYFMDHLHVTGMFVPRDPGLIEKTALYDVRRIADGRILGCKLNLTDAVLRSERLLGSALKLEARLQTRPLLRYLDTYRRLAVKHRQLRPSHFEWSTLPHLERRFSDFSAYVQIELPPDRENRVALGRERDRWGSPLASVRWKWDALTRRSVQRTRQILADTLAEAGLGALKLPEQDPPPLRHAEGINHHIGTTRMHDDPRHGVVDADCRVHGVSNLFIAGSSVFTTGGYANPTLTIVALAIRLADHIRSWLQGPSDAAP